MGFLSETPLEDMSRGFVTLRRIFGFVPKLFRAQTLLPRLIEAEAQILSVVFEKQALSRLQKEWIFLIVAVVHRNSYCATLHYDGLRSLGVSEPQIDLFLN